ncbi:MAG: hypothetical protein AAFN94_01835 [Pseudomonadota bacterium]
MNLGTEKVVLSKFKSVRLLDQRNVHDTQLYTNTEWAMQNDAVEEKPRWKFTCLATAYAMVQAARGKHYRIGPHNWTDSAGIEAISGTGPGAQYDVERKAVKVFSILSAQNCLLANGTSASLGHHGHWVLIVGYSKGNETSSLENFIAFDPFGGMEIAISSVDWSSRGGLAGDFSVSKLRLVVL